MSTDCCIIDCDIRLPGPKRRARRIPAVSTVRRNERTVGNFRYWCEPTQVLVWDETGDDEYPPQVHVGETNRLHTYCPPRRGGPARKWRVLVVVREGRRLRHGRW